MQLGKAIKSIRIAKNISQREVTTEGDFHPSYISQVENDRRFPGWDTLTRICQVLQEPMWKVLLLASVDRFKGSEDFSKICTVFPEMEQWLRIAQSDVDRLPQDHPVNLSLFEN